MKRNLILMTAVALALGTAGVRAAQNEDECAQNATQLKMQIEQSNLADPDRAKLESSLSEAQSTDLARCEQIVARVKREIGASADATTKDDYGAAASRETSNAAGAAAGTTEASPSSPNGMPSGTTDQSPATTDRATGLSGSDSASTDRASGTTGATKPGSQSADSAYEPGHATAEETLPANPGAEANSAEAADTTMKDEGYASPEATTENGAAAPDDDMSATDAADTQNPTTGAPDTQSATTNPGAATTTMHRIDEAKPNPSMNQLAGMTSDELVNKPVKDANGEEVGEINAIVVDRNATPHAYAVVEYGGVLGVGEKQVLVNLDKIELTADGSVRVPATDEDAFSAYPRYEEKLYQKYQGDLGRLLSSGG